MVILFSLPSASISAECDSLTGKVTHTFFPRDLGPLLVLSGLGYCSFPFILITGHGNTKRFPWESPVV